MLILKTFLGNETLLWRNTCLKLRRLKTHINYSATLTHISGVRIKSIRGNITSDYSKLNKTLITCTILTSVRLPGHQRGAQRPCPPARPNSEILVKMTFLYNFLRLYILFTCWKIASPTSRQQKIYISFWELCPPTHPRVSLYGPPCFAGWWITQYQCVRTCMAYSLLYRQFLHSVHSWMVSWLFSFYVFRARVDIPLLSSAFKSLSTFLGLAFGQVFLVATAITKFRYVKNHHTLYCYYRICTH